MPSVEIKKCIELGFWIVSYSPVFLIIMYNFFIKTERMNNLEQVLWFSGIALVTVILYRTTMKCFMKKQNKNIDEDTQNKKLQLRKKNSLSLEQYSFFILSLMLPFIFESTENVFDLLLVLTLVSIIIAIMIKMNQIIVNPIFLFSKVNIYSGEIQKIGNEKTQKIAFITELSNNELESETEFKYEEYFNNVYILRKVDP
ncbi:hypothetical protein ACSSIN_000885 [Enterococcus faecalis]|jgi:hypothetical protein|uniref:hypothetical protein n=1 Tax=Enterococcus TaxID=1350 RepID=UPI0001FFC2AD|nr:hypothetical protein [Enterococcus faecalis]ADX80593.1 putative membrane protein [Enterococcus faecalis 62]EHQ8986900.1 hypothetical protein [Enterococcus faecalis]MBD9826423.1 hypothetical protein [Enterococcus faecalis]MBW4160807.1 hypothetical protein [Enterococcus faecalis]CWW51073.1 Uncharacterised protein [Enterococcus faecalis]